MKTGKEEEALVANNQMTTMKINWLTKIGAVLLFVLCLFAKRQIENNYIPQETANQMLILFVYNFLFGILLNCALFSLLKWKRITYKSFLICISIYPVLNLPYAGLSLAGIVKFCGSLIASLIFVFLSRKKQ